VPAAAQQQQQQPQRVPVPMLGGSAGVYGHPRAGGTPPQPQAGRGRRRESLHERRTNRPKVTLQLAGGTHPAMHPYTSPRSPLATPIDFAESPALASPALLSQAHSQTAV